MLKWPTLEVGTSCTVRVLECRGLTLAFGASQATQPLPCMVYSMVTVDAEHQSMFPYSCGYGCVRSCGCVSWWMQLGL